MKALLLTALLVFSADAFAAIGPSPQSKVALKAQAAQLADFPAPQQFTDKNSSVITPQTLGPGRMCGYIHAFHFQREDDESPRLIGETYCTPMGGFQIHKARKPGIYPRVNGPGKEQP